MEYSFSRQRKPLNQPKATRVCIRLTNQSNRSISVRLFFSVLFARFHFKVIQKLLYIYSRKLALTSVLYMTLFKRKQSSRSKKN